MQIYGTASISRAITPFVTPVAIRATAIGAGVLLAGIFSPDDKHDIAANYQALGPVTWNINSSSVDRARFHHLTVLADEILANETAIFKYGEILRTTSEIMLLYSPSWQYRCRRWSGKEKADLRTAESRLRASRHEISHG